MAAGQGGSLTAGLEELHTARLQLRRVLARTSPPAAKPPGVGNTRLQFLGPASHRRHALFVARVSFRAWASATQHGRGATFRTTAVLVERLFRASSSSLLYQILSAWRLCLRRAVRLRSHERLTQLRAAEVAKAGRNQQAACQRFHERERRMELFCTRQAFSVKAVFLQRRSLLVWRYHSREEQLKTVAEKISSTQTETMLASMNGDAEKALALLSAREAALACELAAPLPRCDTRMLQMLLATGPSLQLALLGSCWLRWQLLASRGASWLRQRRVHIPLGRHFLLRFEACQLLARVVRAWHRSYGAGHRRPPTWCQERALALAHAVERAAALSVGRQQSWLLRCALSAWFCRGCLSPRQRRVRRAAEMAAVGLAQAALPCLSSPACYVEMGSAPAPSPAPKSVQVTTRLWRSAQAMVLRANLRAWRLQVAKEKAFNAMLMLPADEDLAESDILNSASASSAASPSQRWHRARHFEGEGIRSFSYPGVHQPRLDLAAFSAQPQPPHLWPPELASSPALDHLDVPARLSSPLSEDLDDME